MYFQKMRIILLLWMAYFVLSIYFRSKFNLNCFLKRLQRDRSKMILSLYSSMIRCFLVGTVNCGILSMYGGLSIWIMLFFIRSTNVFQSPSDHFQKRKNLIAISMKIILPSFSEICNDINLHVYIYGEEKFVVSLFSKFCKN